MSHLQKFSCSNNHSFFILFKFINSISEKKSGKFPEQDKTPKSQNSRYVYKRSFTIFKHVSLFDKLDHIFSLLKH